MKRDRTRARSVLRACWLALLTLLASCSSADEPLTQIVVVVDGDFSGLTRIEASVSGFEQPASTSSTLTPGNYLPRRFAVVHGGGPLGPIGVTVRAFADGDEPLLIEPRTNLFFQKDKTLLLKIDLLADCIDRCAANSEMPACVKDGDGVRCVDSDDAGVLVAWTGEYDALDASMPFDAGTDGGMIVRPLDGGTDGGMDSSVPLDASVMDATTGDGDAGDDSGTDAGMDAGPDADVDSEVDSGPPSSWPYVPASFDPDAPDVLALARPDLTLNCGTSDIDTTAGTFTNFCNGDASPLVITQSGSADDALLVAFGSLDIPAGHTLRIRGSRPVILLVDGDANIAGTIDASAEGAVSGPGAERDCGTGTGTAGNAGGSRRGGSGGGGGAFGSAGGTSGASNSSASVSGGTGAGNVQITPLRGGCAGGVGGPASGGGSTSSGGGGGGAVQLSVSGSLTLGGVISAAGGGGAAGNGNRGGGGGGGSGGAIVLEALAYSIDPAALLAVNGGGGGGGQDYDGGSSVAGDDGAASLMPVGGGNAPGSGGDGGAGAALASAAAVGEAGGSESCDVIFTCYGGGGGGGGGVGRIRIREAESCVPGGQQSPAASVECPTCASACAVAPNLSCTAAAIDDTTSYFVCSATQTWVASLASCRSVDMDLAVVSSLDEHDFLVSALPVSTWYWIGANDRDGEGDWRWSFGNTPFWSGAAGGTPVNAAFTSWASGEPSDASAASDCGRLSSTGWAATDCTTTAHGYICEK